MKKIYTFLFLLLIAGYALAQTVSVEFRVNMDVQKKEGKFNPATDAVKIAGTFNNWSTTANPMTDPDGDLIYSLTIDTLKAGETVSFKFIKGDTGWESDPNRSYKVPAQNSVFTDYFDRDSVANVTKTLSVTFSANMEYEFVAGRFHPLTDTLSVRGTFNGWKSTDYMLPSVGDPNVYEFSTNVTTAVGEPMKYKFIYVSGKNVTWESGSDRSYDFTDADFTNGSVYLERVFNDLTPDQVTKNQVTIKFTVDMNNAVNSVTGTPFTAVKNVVLAGANPPLAWPSSGWPDTDSTLVYKMYDDGTHGDITAGDNIWSYDLAFAKFSPLRIEYKFGANWGLSELNGGSNDNESSISTNHYINLTSDLLSGTVANKWSTMGTTKLTDVVADVQELPGVVKTYSLDQNYPNPFNPETSIRFGIPEAGQVTLKIFNLLGQEVATLVNEFKTIGNYSVNFNASSLTSGAYFYQIKVNNFTSTKKMLLMK